MGFAAQLRPSHERLPAGPTRIHHPNAAAALGTPVRVVVLTSWNRRVRELPEREPLRTICELLFVTQHYCPASMFAGLMSDGINCLSIKSLIAIDLSSIPALTAMSLICCKSSSVGVSIR